MVFYGPHIWKPNVIPSVSQIKTFPYDKTTWVPGMGYIRGTAIPTTKYRTIPTKTLLVIGGVIAAGVLAFMFLKKKAFFKKEEYANAGKGMPDKGTKVSWGTKGLSGRVIDPHYGRTEQAEIMDMNTGETYVVSWNILRKVKEE